MRLACYIFSRLVGVRLTIYVLSQAHPAGILDTSRRAVCVQGSADDARSAELALFPVPEVRLPVRLVMLVSGAIVVALLAERVVVPLDHFLLLHSLTVGRQPSSLVRPAPNKRWR